MTSETDDISHNSEDLMESTSDTQTLVSTESRPKWYNFLKDQPEEPNENPEGELGMANGVIIPTCLSMFSSLLFLRVGYIVGNAGLIWSFIQLSLAYSILIATVCSISAIATNGSLKGGGVYFMISRTLGPQLGGSVGLLFYLANVVSGSLYAAGFAETLVSTLGPNGSLVPGLLYEGKWYSFGYALAIMSACLAISLVGARLFSKCVIIFAVILLVCLSDLGASFINDEKLTVTFNETIARNCSSNCTYHTVTTHFFGLASDQGSHIWPLLKNNSKPLYARDCEDRSVHVDFFSVFAVLFAGVTGIMAGANVSGELKNPSKAIPKGTFTACGITYFVYLALFFATAATSERNLLHRDCLYMIEIDASSGYIVLTGALLVTACACLNCLIGASRVVEALAADTMFGTIPQFICKNMKLGTNPIGAVITTFVLMTACALIGSLNKIAKLASVLFLMSYLAVNLACLFLEWASAPNFRPVFTKYHWSTCVVGALGCLTMMFVISPTYAGVALACFFICNFLFTFTGSDQAREWGSIGQAMIFHQVRKYLLMLDVRKDHVKFWRPQILLLISNPRHNCALIQFVNSLKKSGLYILGHVHLDQDDTQEDKDPSVTELHNWLKLVDHLEVKAFTEITVAKSIREGSQQLARISGLGAMKPNTVILGFGTNADDRVDYFQHPNSTFHSEELKAHFTESHVLDRDTNKSIELMKTVQDMIRLEKNVCLARNFQKLDLTKKTMVKKNVDVWLIDFFAKPNLKISDPEQSFVMQLGTILTMTKEWKNSQLRVFVRISEEESRSKIVKELEGILKKLRFPATVHTINFTRTFSIVQVGLENVATFPHGIIIFLFLDRRVELWWKMPKN